MTGADQDLHLSKITNSFSFNLPKLEVSTWGQFILRFREAVELLTIVSVVVEIAWFGVLTALHTVKWTS